VGMSRIRLPSRRAEDWRRLLADPVTQWRVGYSAYELAHAWEACEEFPPAVADVLRPSLGPLELLVAFPEHKVGVPGRGGASATDLFALARTERGELVAVAVEGKVGESFDRSVDKWLRDPRGDRDNRRRRLDGLAGLLGLEGVALDEVPYQLLHRTVAALTEARRFNAAHAVLLVHSFSPTCEQHDAYVAFSQVLGVGGEVGRLSSCGLRDDIELHLGWVADRPRSQAHAGEPEAIVVDALRWLGDTYAEHRFFKERDVEAVLQQRMSELFEERRSPWCVIENYQTVDLAVVDRSEPGTIAVGVELKYEPDFGRPGLEAHGKTGKRPVTDWAKVVGDRDKLEELAAGQAVGVGYAVLVDEAASHRRSRTPPPFGAWEVWGRDTERRPAPAALVTRVAGGSQRGRSPL
jgi:hypothetical protein